MARFDSADLVELVQDRGRVPIASGDWTAAKIRKAISDEAEALFPGVIATRGEYNLLTKIVPVVADTSKYRIPRRAFDNALREVWLQEVSTARRIRVTELSAEELTQLRLDMDETGTPKNFWIDDGCVQLYPVPDRSSEWNLHMRYHPRPSVLAAAADCMVGDLEQDVAPSYFTGLVEFTTQFPATWLNETKFDLVRASSPFSILAAELVGVPNASRLSIQFDAASRAMLPRDFEDGVDFVVLAGTTPFLNMPESIALPAALMAAASIIGPQGDSKLAGELRDEAKRKLRDALDALAPRTKSPTKKLNNRRWF